MHGQDGSSLSGVDAYQQCVWVYGAVSILAGICSRADFVVTNNENPVEAGPLYNIVERPNNYSNQNTSAKFREAWFTEILLNGAVMRVFTELNGMIPSEMVVYPRWKFNAHTVVDKNGKTVPIKWALTTPAGKVWYINNDDIYHDALYHPASEWEGLSPLIAGLNMVSNDIAIAQYTNRFFKNDAAPGLVFTSDNPQFNSDQAREATKLWNDSHRGVNKAWKTSFLGNGLKPYQLGTGLDAKILGALKALTKEEIVTGIYKVPLSIFGQTDSASSGGTINIGQSKAASDSERESFLINVAIPWSRRYDEEFNKDVAWRFGPGYRGHHDWSNNLILENRRLARAQAAAELLKHGATMNGVIRWLKLELEETTWGDEWFIANNMIPASVLVKAGDSLLPGQEAARKQSVDEYAKQIVAAAVEGLKSGVYAAPAPLAESHNGNGKHAGNGQNGHVTDKGIRIPRLSELEE